MPSDEHTAAIDRALAPARDAYRGAVALAVEEVRAAIEREQPVTETDRSARVATELGAFASEHIDPARFAALLTSGERLDAGALALLERARATLQEIAHAGEGLFEVHIAPDSDLCGEVAHALARCGRAFGAARVAALVRSGRAALAASQDPAALFPPALWTRAERAIAPPLLVHVAGTDAQVGGLDRYLDGTQKLVLIVRAPAPPAALSALITPGVFVMQTCDGGGFDRFAGFAGPGIAALVPEGCVTFVHDPRATPALTVGDLPAPPRRPVGTHGVFQQTEALRHLEGLAQAYAPAAHANGAAGAQELTGATAPAPAQATVPAGTVPPPATPAAPQPADRLAAWLLAQAGFTEG